MSADQQALANERPDGAPLRSCYPTSSCSNNTIRYIYFEVRAYAMGLFVGIPFYIFSTSVFGRGQYLLESGAYRNKDAAPTVCVLHIKSLFLPVEVPAHPASELVVRRREIQAL